MVEHILRLYFNAGRRQPDGSLSAGSLSVGTSSFGGKQKAVAQQTHSLRPQWDKHNNGRDQCPQSQQRTDKELLKDQQDCFTIVIALRNPLLKKRLNNLTDLQLRSAFTEPSLLVFTLSSRQIAALPWERDIPWDAERAKWQQTCRCDRAQLLGMKEFFFFYMHINIGENQFLRSGDDILRLFQRNHCHDNESSFWQYIGLAERTVARRKMRLHAGETAK